LRGDEDDFYVKRERDSTPPTTLHRNSGGVEPFVRFFETELIPFVNRNNRTEPEDRTNASLPAAVFLSTGKDEGEHHRNIFPSAFARGMRRLFGAPR